MDGGGKSIDARADHDCVVAHSFAPCQRSCALPRAAL
jgi:hypothetical protein